MKPATRCGFWCARIAPVLTWALIGTVQFLPRGAWIRYTLEDIWTATMHPAVFVVNALLSRSAWGHDHVLFTVAAFTLYLTVYVAALGFSGGWLFRRTIIGLHKPPNQSVETTRGT